jgi:hypothetical protein
MNVAAIVLCGGGGLVGLQRRNPLGPLSQVRNQPLQAISAGRSRPYQAFRTECLAQDFQGFGLQMWNGSDLGRSLGVNQTTCRRYLDLLAGVYMVRLLQPWHANLLKRQVKAPKI